MPGEMLRVIDWVKTHGEVRALARFRMQLLPFTLREELTFDEIDEATVVSCVYMDAALAYAEHIVGSSYTGEA